MEWSAEGPYEDVSQLYAGRSVFITGATGFLGKVLVEKLLRFTDVGKIFLLLRPKWGVDIKTRFNEYVNDHVFDRLQSERPGFETKIVPVPGDVTSKGLGLSPEDVAELHREIHIVFHCAANVKFDQTLKDAIMFNTQGTKMVLQLAEGMTQLLAFIHVSTTYCHCDKDEVREVIYPAKYDPQNILLTAEWMNSDLMNAITPMVLTGQPNTYAYTKNLSEHVVNSFSSKFPIGIVRPSIVTAAWKEPVAGWVDNTNGPTGLMIGAGKGVIRSMYCKSSCNVDVVPVDVAINACIALSWKVANVRPKETMVCNVTMSEDNAQSWDTLLNVGRQKYMENPSSQMLWYPGGGLRRSKTIHKLVVFFLHFLPAYFIDFLLVLLGHKPFMVRVQKKVNGGLKLVEYYTTKPFHFRYENTQRLQRSLTEGDRRVYFMDLENLDWDQYFYDYIMGIRKYVLKEDPATLPSARAKLLRMYYVHKVVVTMLYLLLAWLVYNWYPSLITAGVHMLSAVTGISNMAPDTKLIPDRITIDAVDISTNV